MKEADVSGDLTKLPAPSLILPIEPSFSSLPSTLTFLTIRSKTRTKLRMLKKMSKRLIDFTQSDNLIYAMGCVFGFGREPPLLVLSCALNCRLGWMWMLTNRSLYNKRS
jgi:hypothetical protein